MPDLSRTGRCRALRTEVQSAHTSLHWFGFGERTICFSLPKLFSLQIRTRHCSLSLPFQFTEAGFQSPFSPDHTRPLTAPLHPPGNRGGGVACLPHGRSHTRCPFPPLTCAILWIHKCW